MIQLNYKGSHRRVKLNMRPSRWSRRHVNFTYIPMEQLPIANCQAQWTGDGCRCEFDFWFLGWFSGRRVVRGRERGMISCYLSPLQTLSCLVIAKEMA